VHLAQNEKPTTGRADSGFFESAIELKALVLDLLFSGHE
jgi:hypothetical protein